MERRKRDLNRTGFWFMVENPAPPRCLTEIFANTIEGQSMKKTIHSLFLIAAGLILAAASAQAETFTNFYIFTADAFESGSNPQATNGDGVGPNGFVLSGNTLYGTAAGGGQFGYGTVFRVNTDGTQFANLFNFNIGTYNSANGTYTGSTGDLPSPGLLLVSNTLYGTTFYGGPDDAGTVFKIDTNGSNFLTIHAFDYKDGQGPASGLTLYSNVLYGTTVGGGMTSYGTIYSVGLSNLSYSPIYNFATQINPYGGVVVSDNVIYGFGEYGGPSNDGVVYSVTLSGGYGQLWEFAGTNGANPYSTPILVGNTLYGVTFQGGTNGSGNVFRIGTDGIGYGNLYDFTAPNAANTDGAYPYDQAGLLLSGNKLYGTAAANGSGSHGTVFEMNTDGTDFTVLHSFDYADGGDPDALILSGGTLYGLSGEGIQGVSLGDGAIFALTSAPTLNIQLVSNAVVLSWSDPSYSLYSAPTVNGVYTNISGAISPYTNAITASQQYFELQ
jgi:uncharacterized repeat protein (TIGR03803 family)